MKRVAVLIDGGHVRVLAKRAGKTFDDVFVEKLGLACVGVDEQPQRIFVLRLRSIFWHRHAAGVRGHARIHRI